MIKKRFIIYSMLLFLIISITSNYVISLNAINQSDNSKVILSTLDSKIVEFDPLFLNPSINSDMGLNNLIYQGYNGTNITIAILDTGIMYEDLRFDIDGNPNTINDRIVTNHVSYIAGEPDYDLNGHGTTIAGIISARSCYVKTLNFTFSGMAQGVKLWSVKVLDKDGNGNENTIIQGLLYCLENKDEIDIINLSFGLIKNEENENILNQIEDLAKQCWEAGIIVVSAAGNDGDVFRSENVPLYSISAPSSTLDIISVGATKDGGVADFSSIGPSPIDYYIKPDLVAPGSDIITTYKDEGSFVSGVAGTSYSSPIIAGGIAILLDACNNNPNPNLVKAALVDSAKSLGYLFYEEGAGMPNFTKALEFLRSSIYDGIVTFPDEIDFPNFFDPEKESIPQNTHNIYPEINFDKIKVSVIIGKEPNVGVSIVTDDSISGFIIVNQKPMELIGQYIFTIDFVESMFIEGSAFLFSPGTYEGYIRLYDGNIEVDHIYIKVTISFIGLFKIWWGMVAALCVPFLSLLSIWKLKHRSQKSLINSCPSNIPSKYCKCNMDGTKCWVEYPSK